MKIIGLTGGIATGKTTVSNALRELGVPVIDADAVYGLLSKKGNLVWKAVYETFGDEYLRSDGELDRKSLGNLIFSDDKAREKLNEITHPLVKQEMLRILEKIKKEKSSDLVVMDVPLLYESGWDCLMDEVWVVAIPEELQIERLMKRNALSRKEAILRIRSQMDIEAKRNLADRVIDNSGTIEETLNQVK
ncbi:MAG: dephospho-CoA kinase, partial [Clostridiales bacterium]|nr:dephospho-CoA kinase [Clostridiales bacterium]